MKDYTKKQHKYNDLDSYLKENYNSKVFKVALNGNFTCPNRDGTISNKGCIFCSPSGSGDFAGDKNDSLKTQFEKVSSIIHLKWPNALYIAYFQANTNTYKPVEELKKLYEEAISLNDKIVILSIATRPDCLSTEILDYLESLNKRIKIWIELGFQTSNEESALFINRGYKNDVFANAVKELRKRNIDTIVHIINGLPNETKTDMINTVKYLNNFNIQGIKIHSLFVLDNTPLGLIYKKNPFKILSLEEYCDVVTEQIALLSENIIIHRVNGDAPRENLIEPIWSLKKLVVMNEIDKMMIKKNYFQGKFSQGELFNNKN